MAKSKTTVTDEQQPQGTQTLDPADEPGTGTQAGAADAPATELLEYLRRTGTPAGTLRPLRAWLDGNAGATARDLYGRMDTAAEVPLPDGSTRPGDKVTVGTRRKALRWLTGDPAAEPDDVDRLAPAEELDRLRQENARLQDAVAEQSARRFGVEAQVTHLRRQVSELTRQVQALQAGRTPDELLALGIDAAAGA